MVFYIVHNMSRDIYQCIDVKHFLFCLMIYLLMFYIYHMMLTIEFKQNILCFDLYV